jgi:hypothetical protein
VGQRKKKLLEETGTAIKGLVFVGHLGGNRHAN